MGVAGYLVVLVMSDFSVAALLFGLPLLVLGLGLRVWAAGYMGPHGRGRDVRIAEVVRSGPYAWTAHPLYMGNGLLVAGVLVSLSPPWWLRLAVGVIFVVEYYLIARAEEAARDMTEVSDIPDRVPNATKRFSLRWAWGEWRTATTVGAALALGALRSQL